MPPFNTVPGLVPLKIYSGSTLLTTNVNLINFTGSGVTTTVNAFNGLTVTIGGGGTTVDTGSLLTTASFSNPNLTFTKGDGSTFNVNLITLVPTSASYALTSSYAATASVAISASYAPVTPPFPYTGSAQITGSLGVTGSVSLRSGSNLTINNGLISASYGTLNLSVGGTPGWTSGTRNTAFGLSNQGSVTTQTDNTSVGYLSLLGGNYNTTVGSYAAQLNTGDGNVALGYYALGNQTSTTSYNVAIGWQSMYNASGSGNTYNVGIGYQSLYTTRGTYNIGIGYRAGFGLTTGYQNIFLGFRAGIYTSTSGDNIAIGYQAGLKISGSDNSNILIGTSAGGADSGGATLMGSGNVGIGVESLLGISSSAGLAPGNVAVGFQSGRGLTTGSSNILLGYRAGWGIGRGSGNIFMGTDVGLQSTTQAISNNISIGNSSLNVNVSASFNIALGISALSLVGATASGANNGSYNIGLGYNAGSVLKTGVYNIFIGAGSGRNNSGNPVGNGSYNTFIGAESGVIQGNNGDWGTYGLGIGYAAMGYNGGITPVAPGAGNTALGSLTLTRISSSISTRNTAVGYNAGVVLSVGANNTFLGAYAGNDFITGSSNIFVGDNAGDGIVSGSNNTIIGLITGLTASLDNTIIIGAGSTERMRIDSSGSMGLGTTSPSSSAKLQIDSTNQGFLPPRMTNAQRTSITSPSIGLMVYCTDATEGLYINKSTGWTFII